MNIESDLDVCKIILNSLKETFWRKAIFKTSFTENGSSNPKLWIYDKKSEEIFFDFNEVFAINRHFKSLFKQFLENTEKKFNKVEFEVFEDGTFHPNLFWDDFELKSQEKKAADVFPQWLNERMLNILFTLGYGDEKLWQKGVFIFNIKNKDILVNVTLFNTEKPNIAKIHLPHFIIEEILLHHEITNNGLLSDTWPKWNMITINSPHNSLNLDKDVEYRFQFA